MAVRWVKKGLIYAPRRQHEWNLSHAQLPIVDVLNEERWRIYFATRDVHNRSNISFIEVAAGEPENILYEHAHTLLPFGRLGTFDENGIMPLSIVTHGAQKYLYYAGWTVRATIPYHNSIGLARSTDGGVTFTKYGEGPIFDLRPHEPYFTGTACVMMEQSLWRIWYQSCTEWKMIDGRPEPLYHIKYAESPDGINWKRDGTVAIDYEDASEGGICSATVLKEDNLYKMWYSTRRVADYRTNPANTYRIGYAESNNGIAWTRKDEEAGIELSSDGWDSEMNAYPFVLKHHDTKFMFYNGNGFGKSGFGYAIFS